MDIPKNIQTHNLPASIIWVQEGIVYSTPKMGISQELTEAQMKIDMTMFRGMVGSEKVCMVVEINPRTKAASKEERDSVANEITNATKAMALITTSPITKMIANLYFSSKPPAYHVKMFLNETDASRWIRQYV